MKKVAVPVLCLLASIVVPAYPASAAVNSSVSGGVLTVTGGAADDDIEITCSGGNVKVSGADPGTGVATCASITGIVINGGGGNDTLDASAVVTPAFSSITAGVTVRGGGGADYITGSGFADHLYGGKGDDGIAPMGGDDIIDGGPSSGEGNYMTDLNVVGNATLTDTSYWSTTGGTDTLARITEADLYGDGGPNALDATAFSGDAYMTGGDGADTLLGGSGNDTLVGGNDNDLCNGHAGDDWFDWDPGTDGAIGGPGDDTFTAQDINGNATLTDSAFTVGAVVDAVTGMETADLYADANGRVIDASAFSGGGILAGGDGNDTLSAGSTGTLIEPGAGADTVHGGVGADLLDVSAYGAATLVPGTLTTAVGTTTFDQIEKVRIYMFDSGGGTIDVTAYPGKTFLYGGSGNDTILGGPGKTLAQGWDGNDVLNGGGGNDRLSGDDGRDQLVGGAGKDICTGGAGKDSFHSCEITKP